MLKDIKWPPNRAYRTASDWEPLQFYLDVLSESKTLDLHLGFFSSSAINVLALGFAKFLSSGGKVRLIINNILSAEDKSVIKRVSDGYVYQIPFDLENFSELRSRLDDYDIHFFQCLGWLIQNERIEIKMIRPLDKRGITHYKCGVLSDGLQKVGFSGSCNFTYFGLLENLERIEVFYSGDVGFSNEWIKTQDEDFNAIFSEKAAHVEYLNIDDIKTAISSEFGLTDIDELIIQEGLLLERKKSVFKDKKIKKVIDSSKKRIQDLLDLPRFPYPDGPREYQQEAYVNWVAKNYQGIFAMATGTGKTITSLNCLLEESKLTPDGVYHALIIVPTLTLVNQWKDESNSFNFTDIIKVSSKEDWESTLATTLSTARRVPTSFIVITTYSSFIRDKFFNYISKFPADTILIADEAHNIGSPLVLNRIKNFPLLKRVGLSATPKRIYDLEGSTAMEGFFNDEEPYTYSFSMERAIEEGILCKYYYYPHIVHLTDEELKEYIEITKTLSKFYNKELAGYEVNDIVERLLLKRKRIIHKAENKLAIAQNILKNRFEESGHLRYTFVYVPEGKTFDVDEVGDPTDEEISLINQYSRAIGQIDDSIMVNQFTSGMPDRDEILNQFKAGTIQVIASMKCLDEGVDIPRAEHAIFCSSTGNPRQFIQRRGRILRKHDDKLFAVIHDLVVIPNLTESEDGAGTYDIERNLVEKELERVMYFASLSMNPYDTEKVFEKVCTDYDLNIYTIHQNLKLQ